MNEQSPDALTAEAFEAFTHVLARCTPEQVSGMPKPLADSELWILMCLASIETTPAVVPSSTWHRLQQSVREEAERRGWFAANEDDDASAHEASELVFETMEHLAHLSDEQLVGTLERTAGAPLPGVHESAWRMLRAGAVQEAARRKLASPPGSHPERLVLEQQRGFTTG